LKLGSPETHLAAEAFTGRELQFKAVRRARKQGRRNRAGPQEGSTSKTSQGDDEVEVKEIGARREMTGRAAGLDEHRLTTDSAKGI